MAWNEETEAWDIKSSRTSLRLAYSLAIGRAQGRMKWYYTMDECKHLMADEDEDSV